MSFKVPDKVLVKKSNPNQKIGYSKETFHVPDGWREATEEEYKEHVSKIADANGYDLEEEKTEEQKKVENAARPRSRRRTRKTGATKKNK